MWEAEPGSGEADRLDVLATLIEAYEEKNHPILPPDPVEAIPEGVDRRVPGRPSGRQGRKPGRLRQPAVDGHQRQLVHQRRRGEKTIRRVVV